MFLSAFLRTNKAIYTPIPSSAPLSHLWVYFLLHKVSAAEQTRVGGSAPAPVIIGVDVPLLGGKKGTINRRINIDDGELPGCHV